MFLLLLIIALTCFGRSSWSSSGSLYVYQHVQFVSTYMGEILYISVQI